MKIKIGDKVRITDKELHRRYVGNTGTIMVTDRIKKGFSNFWDYKVKFDNKNLGFYVFNRSEIEPIFTKNQQLLFEFMDLLND